MMNTVLKLGGSLITEKDKPYTPRKDAIARIAEEIYRALSQGASLAVVHGGGSFGHYEASKSIEEHGGLVDEDVSRIAYSMDLLNMIVGEALHKQHVPYLSFPPHSFCMADCDKGFKCDFSVILQAFRKNIVPLTYGDIILDRGNCPPQIVSGDDLVLHLSMLLRAERIVFAMDVPGLLLPGPEGESLVKEISVKELPRIIEKIGEAKGRDVTMGFRGKLIKIHDFLNASDYHPMVVLLSGLVENNVYHALVGKSFRGTIILT